MPKFLRTTPALLICIRFALGPILWWSVYNKISPWWFLVGFIIAYLPDIFDGIIARRLGVSTPAFRTADSWVDTWFYFWVAISMWTTDVKSIFHVWGNQTSEK